MSLLDEWGLDLQDDFGNPVRFTLRKIITAIAEDEQARKLIGQAIMEAPLPQTIMPICGSDAIAGPAEVFQFPKFSAIDFEPVASLAIDDGDSGL